MNKITRALALSAISVNFLFLAGCVTQIKGDKAGMLVGSWDCRSTLASTDGGETVKFAMTIQYLSNQKSNANVRVYNQEDGLGIEVDFVGSGTWEVDGDYLIEEIKKLSIVDVNMFGQTVLMSDLPDEMARELSALISAYQGTSGITEIRALTASQLVLYDPTERATIKCSAL